MSNSEDSNDKNYLILLYVLFIAIGYFALKSYLFYKSEESSYKMVHIFGYEISLAAYIFFYFLTAIILLVIITSFQSELRKESSAKASVKSIFIVLFLGVGIIIYEVSLVVNSFMVKAIDYFE